MRDTELYDEDTDTYYGLDYVDEDDDFDRYHCVHGTYIGTPGGPDLMCGWCEDGVSLEEYREIMHHNRLHRIRGKLKNYVWQLIIQDYRIAQTFIHIPGNKETITDWLMGVQEPIKELSDEELLALEEEVYSNSRW